MSDTLVGSFTVSLQDSRILLPSHHLVNDDQVRFVLGNEPVNALPTPLVEGTHYFVVDARVNDFRVALDQGGSFIVIADKGVGGTNEVWKTTGHPTWQMSSTVTAQLPPKDFAVLKLLV